MKRKVRIGIIGAGSWAAENHIPILKRNADVELAGICATGSENLGKVQREFDIPFATERYEELLAHCELDGVIISSPHVCHYEHARSAIMSGCHVLVEKPFTTNSAQANDLVRLESENKVVIVVPFGWNFSDMAQAALQHIRDGLLGQIRHVSLHMATQTADLFLGKSSTDTGKQLLQPISSTWADPRFAGGFGWGQLSHALGLLFLLVDDRPQLVYALLGRSPSGVDLFDAATVRLASGATVAISGSSGVAVHAKSQLDLRLFGTAGHLSLDFERERVQLDTLSGSCIQATVSKGEGLYRCVRPVEYFIGVCLGRHAENLGSGTVGCWSTSVLEGIYRSAESGQSEIV